MKLLPIFMTLLAFFDTLKAKRLKILISSPTLGYSHMQFQGAIADALAKQGHEVHLLIFQGFPTPDANYTGSNLAQKVIKVAKDQTNDAIFKTDLMANPFEAHPT
uniref:Uncharacterized protein n=1 Tax=Ditylenchus dipsaci TaxID=166011 RepID=A0A915CMW0_9BILA